MIGDLPSNESLAGETESDLQDRFSDYRAAIESLPNRGDRDCDRIVLNALLARESLAKAIGESRQNPIDLLTEIGALDEELKAKAGVIVSCAGARSFQKWRDLVQPSESAWWWFLDKRVSDASRARAIVWMLLTGFAVTLTISIAAEISTRFLVGVPDKYSILTTASQAFLALLAGSSFTQAGREWIGRLLGAMHVKTRFQPFFGFVLALVVLSAVIAFRSSLPAIAKLYNERGTRFLQDNKVGAALEDFHRAVSLNPDYPEAQYNLAYTQESVFDYDKAIANYQKAIEISPDFDEAYNNLAHLYLVYKSDYKRALDILIRILSKPIQEPSLEYATYKNRAWAYMGQNQLALSENDLQLAQNIQDTAEIHCIRGEVFWRKADKKADKKAAVDEWKKCLDMAKSDSQGLEPYWQAIAMSGIGKE